MDDFEFSVEVLAAVVTSNTCVALRLVSQVSLIFLGEAVDRVQAAQHLFHALRQALECSAGAGDQGVTPVGWHLDAVQGICKRGPRKVREVGVPEIAEVDLVVGRLSQFMHLRVIGQAIEIGVNQWLTERAHDSYEVARRQVLVWEEQRMMFGEQVVHGCRIEIRIGQVDAPYLGAERPG